MMLREIPYTDIGFTKVAELGNDVLPLLNQLREKAPGVWSDSLHVWVVTRHADAHDHR